MYEEEVRREVLSFDQQFHYAVRFTSHSPGPHPPPPPIWRIARDVGPRALRWLEALELGTITAPLSPAIAWGGNVHHAAPT